VEELKTYIESGILELYVLGDLNTEEILEVGKMAAQYPEIKAELEAIENALKAYAISNSIQPSSAVRDRILGSLKTNSNSGTETPIISMNSSGKTSDFYRYAFAASVALLIVSAILLLNLNNKLRESNSQLAILQLSNEKFTNRVNFMDRELEDSRKFLEIYQNPSQFKMVSLKGSSKAPKASMMVAFNPEKEDVMIDMSSLAMPSNDDDHQYQLWALVDGKPVDLGVFDSSENNAGMKRMKSVKGAQAFAVTLEPKGGSVNPTMEQMMAIGNI